MEDLNDIDSPQYLIPPIKFDSTPRSRSQSVELPEFTIAGMSYHHHVVGSNPDSGRKMSLSHHEQRTIDPTNVHVMVQPPSPIFVHPKVDNQEEGLAALMRSRSGQDPDNPENPGEGIKIKQPSSWSTIKLGTPPAKRSSEAFQFPTNPSIRVMPGCIPIGRDLATALGPSIMITPMSELESDAENSSSIPTTSTRMNYLSPFTIITTCASRTASESNLSSSGYSSMASPGPSRSGSSNPLCISESEDTSTPTKTFGTFFPKLMVPGNLSFKSCTNFHQE